MTLPAQVGAPGPRNALTLLTSKAAAGAPALCKPKDRTFGITEVGWAGAQGSFPFIPGLTGSGFCLKAPLVHGHPGKEQETGGTLASQTDFSLYEKTPVQYSFLCANRCSLVHFTSKT